MNQVNSRLEITEEKISELETRQQKLSKIRLKKTRVLMSYGTTSSGLVPKRGGNRKVSKEIQE